MSCLIHHTVTLADACLLEANHSMIHNFCKTCQHKIWETAGPDFNAYVLLGNNSEILPCLPAHRRECSYFFQAAHCNVGSVKGTARPQISLIHHTSTLADVCWLGANHSTIHNFCKLASTKFGKRLGLTSMPMFFWQILRKTSPACQRFAGNACTSFMLRTAT